MCFCVHVCVCVLSVRMLERLEGVHTVSSCIKENITNGGELISIDVPDSFVSRVKRTIDHGPNCNISALLTATITQIIADQLQRFLSEQATFHNISNHTHYTCKCAYAAQIHYACMSTVVLCKFLFGTDFNDDYNASLFLVVCLLLSFILFLVHQIYLC